MVLGGQFSKFDTLELSPCISSYIQNVKNVRIDLTLVIRTIVKPIVEERVYDFAICDAFQANNDKVGAVVVNDGQVMGKIEHGMHR